MDAGYPGNEGIEGWYTKHKVVCSNKWLCEEDDCNKRPEMRRQHFLLCARHWKESKVRTEDFIKSIDSKFLPPDTRFFPLAPVEEKPATSESCHFSQASDSSDIDDFSAFANQGIQTEGEYLGDLYDDVDLITDPPIYMLQTTPSPSGEPLLLFFDSGCYGASLSKKAYSVLQTQTVRKGPTVMNVAGARFPKGA